MGRGAMGEPERGVGVGLSCPTLLLLALRQLCHGGGQETPPTLQNYAPGLSLLCSHKTELHMACPVACSVDCKPCTPPRCWGDFVSVAGAACAAGGAHFGVPKSSYPWEDVSQAAGSACWGLHHRHPNALRPPPHDPADLGPMSWHTRLMRALPQHTGSAGLAAARATP